MPLAGFEAAIPANVRPLGSALLTRMQTWKIAVNKNGYDFETFYWPWTKTDIPIRSANFISQQIRNPCNPTFVRQKNNPPHGSTAPSVPGPPHSRGFTITLRHTTLGRTPVDEWSARRRGFYFTTHNTQKRQTSMPLAGFEHTIPASERPQNHALDCAAARKQYLT
jgi:hypothetical protein